MSTTHRIAAILRQHVGRANAVSSRTIARRLGWRAAAQRDIRRLISAAQADGTFEAMELPVVAVPGGGYFIAGDFEEFQIYRSHLRALVAEAKSKLAAFDRLAKSFGIKLQ